jgi:hypothetical protein
MKHISIGGLDVSRIGLGAMSMAGYYNIGAGSDAESIRTIHRALERGVTHLDTAEIYGPYTNEELVGRAIKGRRHHVVLATRFGIVSHSGLGPREGPLWMRTRCCSRALVACRRRAQASWQSLRKMIISCSLPMNTSDTALAVAHTSSGAQVLARKVRKADVISAFSTVPSEVLFKAFDAKRWTRRRPSLMYCGDDQDAKEIAATLIRDVGFEPVDAGPLRIARYLEPFALAMAQLAYEGDEGPEIAYRIERCGRNRREILNDEIDVVHGSARARSSVFSKLCVDCQAAGQRTANAVSKHGLNDLRGSTRIFVIQHGREHIP